MDKVINLWKMMFSEFFDANHDKKMGAMTSLQSVAVPPLVL